MAYNDPADVYTVTVVGRFSSSLKIDLQKMHKIPAKLNMLKVGTV